MINLKYLVKYEWKVFINHVCQYYPIPISLLNKFEDVFNWRYIERNKRIAWDRELIYRYKEKFRWWIFTSESEFHWEVDDINRFKGYLDINRLGRNKHFKVTEEILNKPPKKGFKIVDNNIYFTQKLKSKFPNRIETNLEQNENSIKIEFIDEDELKSKIRHLELKPSISLYELYFENELNDELLESILKDVTENTQKYFHLSLKGEMITNYSLPSYFSSNPTYELESFESEIKDFFNSQKKRVCIEGVISDGKKIVPELIELDASLGTIYLISNHLRNVLEKFGNYNYYDLDVNHKNLIVDSCFSAISLPSRKIERVVDYSKVEFKVHKQKAYNIQSPFEPIDININSQEKFWDKRSKLRKQELRLYFHSHPVKEPYDIFIKSTGLIVSEFLKVALEQVFPFQFKFHLAKELNITIPENEYLKKVEKFRNIDWKSMGIGHTTTKPDKELIFYKRKQKRLKKIKITIPKDEFSTDEYRDIEIKLNIIIPIEVKQRIQKGLPEGYELLDIKKFYLQNEYVTNLPRTVNSLIVAENGVGGEVGFILSKESDYVYEPILVEFLHEIGEIKYIDKMNK